MELNAGCCNTFFKDDLVLVAVMVNENTALSRINNIDQIQTKYTASSNVTDAVDVLKPVLRRLRCV